MKTKLTTSSNQKHEAVFYRKLLCLHCRFSFLRSFKVCKIKLLHRQKLFLNVFSLGSICLSFTNPFPWDQIINPKLKLMRRKLPKTSNLWLFLNNSTKNFHFSIKSPNRLKINKVFLQRSQKRCYSSIIQVHWQKNQPREKEKSKITSNTVTHSTITSGMEYSSKHITIFVLNFP
jgi:hypothetical protein